MYGFAGFLCITVDDESLVFGRFRTKEAVWRHDSGLCETVTSSFWQFIVWMINWLSWILSYGPKHKLKSPCWVLDHRGRIRFQILGESDNIAVAFSFFNDLLSELSCFHTRVKIANQYHFSACQRYFLPGEPSAEFWASTAYELQAGRIWRIFFAQKATELCCSFKKSSCDCSWFQIYQISDVDFTGFF